MSGTANVNELALRLGGGPSWAMVRTHFDIQSFGVNAYIAEEPGIRIVERPRRARRAGGPARGALLRVERPGDLHGQRR